MPRCQIKVIPFNKRVPYKATELLYIRAIFQTKKTISNNRLRNLNTRTNFYEVCLKYTKPSQGENAHK